MLLCSIYIYTEEITYPYLAILPLLFLYLLSGKKPFYPPSPVQSRHLYRWLIDWIFNRIFFVSFCLRVHWCISAFFCVLYKCCPLCISYFLKKQRITFFDPPRGPVWAKIVSPWLRFLFCKSLGPFSRAWVTKPVFAALAFTGGLFFNFLGAF